MLEINLKIDLKMKKKEIKTKRVDINFEII